MHFDPSLEEALSLVNSFIENYVDPLLESSTPEGLQQAAPVATRVQDFRSLITAAPELRLRNAIPEPQADCQQASQEIQQASQQASQQIQQASQQASQSIQQASQQASQAAQQASQSASQAIQQFSNSASQSIAAASRSVSSAISSASAAIASAQSSAAQAISQANQSMMSAQASASSAQVSLSLGRHAYTNCIPQPSNIEFADMSNGRLVPVRQYFKQELQWQQQQVRDQSFSLVYFHTDR
jgi:F0F1-type ATP synthase membrane subunit b/b'